MKINFLLCFLILVSACSQEHDLKNKKEKGEPILETVDRTSLILLGTMQDAGSPQIACAKACCTNAYANRSINGQVISLGLIDTDNSKTYLFEATPDIARQMKKLTQTEGQRVQEVVDGIFLTHAHIGHYTGLMYFGKEAMDAKKLPVYVMPKMKNFLVSNAPWAQLVTRENVVLNEIQDGRPVELSKSIEVTPFLVPHRDEYSETVGYKIRGPNKTALFIPDIDKWEKWSVDILEEIKQVDYAFLDATFFSGKELNNRDMSEIPHPSILESMATMKELSIEDKAKVVFIHFNHTNPIANPNSEESKLVIEEGFRIGRENEVFDL